MSETKKSGFGILGLLFKLTFWSIVGFSGYMSFMYYEYVKKTPIENVLVRGRCILKETEAEILISSKQMFVTEALEDGTFDGIIRSTGEEVNCKRKVFVEVFGQFNRLPEALRPKHMTELDPIVEVRSDISQFTSMKNKNILVSGECKVGDKIVTLRHEALTVYNVKRIKGLFYYETLRYKDSEKLFCPHQSVSISEATTFDVEKAKLDGMSAKDYVGKTVVVTGICTRDGTFEVEKRIRLPLIAEVVKVIDLTMKDGVPNRVRVGIGRNGSIATCGDLGKFVVEPYIDGMIYGKKN